MRTAREVAKTVALPLIMLMGWHVISTWGNLPPSQSARPQDVIGTLWQLIVTGEIINHTVQSVVRLILGVLVGSIMAVAFSITVVSIAGVSSTVLPTVRVLAGVPVVLWMPVCVMVFGTDELYKVSLVSIASFFLVQLFVLQALKSIEDRYIDLARLLGLSRNHTVEHVLLPAALPAILTSLRSALAAGWIILFFVEFSSSEKGREGLGWYIADARHAGRIEHEFAALIWLAILALILDAAVVWFERRRLVWVDASAARAERT